jgi:hypothetical protein
LLTIWLTSVTGSKANVIAKLKAPSGSLPSARPMTVESSEV